MQRGCLLWRLLQDLVVLLTSARLRRQPRRSIMRIVYAAIAAFISIACTIACQPAHREYDRSFARIPSRPEACTGGECSVDAGTVPDAGEDGGETTPEPPSELACPPNDCSRCGAACTYDKVCPEMAKWCGVTCNADETVDSACPAWPVATGPAIQLQPLFCGGEPPPKACMIVEIPVCEGTVQTYCCTPDLSTLPVLPGPPKAPNQHCTNNDDSQCPQPPSPCAETKCFGGGCYVVAKANGLACNAGTGPSSGSCWKGFCASAAE